MSNKSEREKRREEREAQEAKASSSDRRTRLLQIGAGAVFLAIVAVVVVIVIAGTSSSSGGDATKIEGGRAGRIAGQRNPAAEPRPRRPESAGRTDRVRRPAVPGLQRVFGRIPAPIVEKQVKHGKAKIVFRNFTIIGPESIPAGQAAIAAGNQGKGWDFLELFYRNQGEERSGYVTEEFLEAIGKSAGVKDMAKFNKERKAGSTKEEVEDDDRTGVERSASTERPRSRSRARAPTASNSSGPPETTGGIRRSDRTGRARRPSHSARLEEARGARMSAARRLRRRSASSASRLYIDRRIIVRWSPRGRRCRMHVPRTSSAPGRDAAGQLLEGAHAGLWGLRPKVRRRDGRGRCGPAGLGGRIRNSSGGSRVRDSPSTPIGIGSSASTVSSGTAARASGQRGSAGRRRDEVDDAEAARVEPRPRSRAQRRPQPVRVVGDEDQRGALLRLAVAGAPAQLGGSPSGPEGLGQRVEQSPQLRLAVAGPG